MKTAFFLSLPSQNVQNTLLPVAELMGRQGWNIKFFNTSAFLPRHSSACEFKSYPSYSNGFKVENITTGISFFQYAELLLDTATSLMDFLLDEVRDESPDVIIHSQLAIWGKLLAKCFNIPSVTLFSTAVLDRRIMLPFIRQLNHNIRKDHSTLNNILNFQRKAHSLYKKLNLEEAPDVWDAYVNKGLRNIAFIQEDFQPDRGIFGPDFYFLGHTSVENSDPETIKKKGETPLIYISMGTIFNKDFKIYADLLKGLKDFKVRVILSIGNQIRREEVGVVPDNVQVVNYADQISILKQSTLFITHGGMSSVQEAVMTRTPMIVLPSIPEQRLNAIKIQELGLGIQIIPSELNEARLSLAVNSIFNDYPKYQQNIERIAVKNPDNAIAQAVIYINELLLSLEIVDSPIDR
jgi:MGT family glycosyltransferase